MARRALITACLALSLSAVSAEAQFAPPANVQGGYWSPRVAETQCRNQLRSQYGVSNTRAVTTGDRGNGRFQVTGSADRNNQTTNFDCWVESGSVRNLTVGRWQAYNGGGGNAVAAVGAALVLGAIIAAATSKKKSHEYDQYPDGNGNGQAGGDDSFSPAPGIFCYRQQRACFDGNNNYNPGWTSREFGY